MRTTSIIRLALTASGLALTATPRPTLSDAEVIGIYIQVNSFDVEAALLARAQASSKAVRTLATQVAAEARNANLARPNARPDPAGPSPASRPCASRRGRRASRSRTRT